jgi:hypothetical protein
MIDQSMFTHSTMRTVSPLGVYCTGMHACMYRARMAYINKYNVIVIVTHRMMMYVRLCLAGLWQVLLDARQGAS